MRDRFEVKDIHAQCLAAQMIEFLIFGNMAYESFVNPSVRENAFAVVPKPSVRLFLCSRRANPKKTTIFVRNLNVRPKPPFRVELNVLRASSHNYG